MNSRGGHQLDTEENRLQSANTGTNHNDKEIDDPAASSSNEDWIKCSQCNYSGPVSSFPLRLNGTGHVRTCAKHTRPRRNDSAQPSLTTLNSISWDELLEEIRSQADGQIQVDRFVSLDSNHGGACGETLLIRANTIMDGVKRAAGYRFK